MPLKYCQYSQNATSRSATSVASIGDGDAWILLDQNQIFVNGALLISGGADDLFRVDAPYQINNFSYNRIEYGSGANQRYSALTRYQGAIFTTAYGGASTNIRISSDANAVAYNQSSTSVIVRTLTGGSWNQKGGLITGGILDINKDGNIVSVFDGGVCKLYSWNGSSWQFLQSLNIIPNPYDAFFFAASVDRIILREDSLIKVYELSGGIFQRIGNSVSDDFPYGRIAISPNGTKISNEPGLVYGLSGNVWSQIQMQGNQYSNDWYDLSLNNSSLLARNAGYNYTFFELLTVPQAASGQVFSGKVGQTFSAVTPQIIDGPSIYWQASGLPPGLSINQSTGLITGTPTTKGIYASTITPSSEVTADFWRWGLPQTVTFNIDDKNRLFYGSLANPNISFGNVGANMIYYGSQKIYPPTV